MKDKSLGIFLIMLFGISGIVILMLAWVWPMPAEERIMTTFIGSAGLLVALTMVRQLGFPKPRTDDEQVMVKVEAEDKP